MGGVHRPGGILQLRRLAEEHEAEFIHAIRHGGWSVKELRRCENPGEVLAYLTVAMGDPASPLGAKIRGWKYPLSREAQATLDLFDLTVAINSTKKTKPRERPWDTGIKIQATAIPIEDAEARLTALQQHQ